MGDFENTDLAKRTCGNAVVETLCAHDLTTLYCLPGVQNDWFFNAVYDAGDNIRAIHTRHEQGAAYMALGAAMATGKPSVYSVVPGPGVLNTTAALATAYSANAPVLCLSGQLPSGAIGKGFGLLHEIPDQSGILERLTKSAKRVEQPEQAADDLARAIHALTDGRPRPVALEIPPDILAAKGSFGVAEPLPPARGVAPDAGAIADAARLIAAAKRPMIIVGGGALDAAEDITALAEETGAPVYSYRMGRGVMDDRNPLSLTLPMAYRYWRDCDLVIGIGTRLQMPVQQWGVDAAMKFIRIDVDAVQLGIIQKADVPIHGDAGQAVPKLRAELARIGARPVDRAEEIARSREGGRQDMAYLEPQISYLGAIRDALGEDGVLVDDLTQVGYVSRFAYPVYHPRSYICSGYQGTLGWGYATALGVQDARPGTPVVSIAGDGGFMFTVQELATAAQHNIPLVGVVFNDGAFGNVQRMQRELYDNRVIATDLRNPDFGKLAESFGVAAYRAETPEALRQVLEKALAAGVPALVEVPIGQVPDPFKIIMSPRLRGKAQGAKP
ncbi:thiamine pyrophosphate-dependent enzyme [Aquicoccus sp. G2-2]|uniref:thiamine pyrophosphate-dependent enzyme n=1 Tax=Aquicoccus sp. G2-2 TaxID=3092120 RepID=UPI002ADF11D6|nr:thiamine pyrophosphate-dependent enzyme [Aquicoccus sp. G2-2]MEA1114821.1 thiamine pyrophosphate-binding protein [Aquicoccus sp. G2-2]